MCRSDAGLIVARFADPFQPLGLIVEKVCSVPAMTPQRNSKLDASDSMFINVIFSLAMPMFIHDIHARKARHLAAWCYPTAVINIMETTGKSLVEHWNWAASKGLM